ncbi:hypothetical protein OS493_032173 [Desmophyllum pertusum]|uniref:Leucine-rich repeat-containing N-terminal plant-type domain-containing protein n=1 Tax=Desmophyllum pertusum TaxID=174260 RepID=A0A9X0A0B7_9CNID|nr:hypothetical protein OS493_032173 [Desmophyllum pertusum]
MYDTSFTPKQEREVLLDIYTSTNGQQWYENSGWNSSTSHCSWYGISCHNNTYIKTIVLAYNNLDGFLPSNLWKIRNVMSLCTPGNPRLRGRIGDFLFGNMSKLLTVVFNAASIAGNIPEDLAQLRSLQNFLGCIMDGEGFTGRIPEDIGNMTELRVLCLGGNNLTGQIPRSITRLKKLWYLDLRNTPGKMHGHLSDLFAIPSLTDMFISGVELIGEMPHMLPEKIRYLVLPGNNISGKFPQTFPKTNSLGMLNVANNQLTGDVPGQLLLLPGIDMIDLSQNKFSSINRGRSWSKNDSATVKSFISLAGNRNLSLNFTSFMELFSKHVDFVESPSILNLSFCDIKSPVPANLFYLERMSTCDLRGNRFYGEIPTFLEDFSFLTYFDISSNNLSGSLPVGIQNLISLQYLDISGNPSMRQGTSASSNVFSPDVSKMVRPPEGDNFTCPEGRLTFNNGRIRLDPTFYEYRHCICDADFYGEIGLCKKCMDGGTCIQHTVTLSEDLRPNIMKIGTGYWPSPHPQNATHLVKCPVSSACNPSDLCTCRLDTTPQDTNSTRYRPSVSSLITTCNQSCICHSGNTDRFCSRCKDGFYKIGGLCFRCTKGDLTYYYLFIPIFALFFLVLLWSYFYFKLRPIKWFAVTAVHFLLMLIFMLLEFLPAWVFKLNLVVFVLCMTSRGKNARSLISITVFYIQTMDFMVSSANVWPQTVVAAQKYLSSYWNLYFPSLSCDFPTLFTPVGKFAFLLLLPVVCMATVGLYFVILLTYNKRKNMSPEDRQKLDAWLGPVYLPYKPKYQPYFEIVMLFRRLFLAIALSMISSSSTLQTFVVWLILMVSAIIDLRLQPYNERSSDRCTQDNFFEPLVLFVLSMSFILLRFSALDSSYTSGFVWVVMIVNICVLVALVGAIFYLLVSKGNGRDNGSSVVGNMECGDGALEDDENDNVEDRSHLLPVNNVVVDDVA